MAADNGHAEPCRQERQRHFVIPGPACRAGTRNPDSYAEGWITLDPLEEDWIPGSR
jgi:hypothetical protein